MALKFEVYTHVHQIPVEWDMFASKDLQINNISIEYNADLENVNEYYLCAKVNNEIIFVSYYQLLKVKPKHFRLKNKMILQFFLYRSLEIVKPTLLVAGNLFRHDCAFFHFCEKLEDIEYKKSIFKEALDYMIKYTKATGIFLKDLPDEISENISKDVSCKKMDNDISMYFDIPSHWNSILDYEKILKHKYLQRHKKIVKAFKDVEVRLLDNNEIKKYKKEMYLLYKQVTNNQMVSMGLLNEDYIEKMKEALGDNYLVHGFFIEDELIAFSSAITHQNMYDMNYIGFNYQYNQTYQLYFNILIHCLQNAIQSGYHKLILGRTALEAKAILGCKPDYKNSYYKLRNRLVNWFYLRISKYFANTQGDMWKHRHPFKSEYYS